MLRHSSRTWLLGDEHESSVRLAIQSDRIDPERVTLTNEVYEQDVLKERSVYEASTWHAVAEKLANGDWRSARSEAADQRTSTAHSSSAVTFSSSPFVMG